MWYRCANGHEWQAADDATLRDCPECGAAAQEEEFADELPPPPPKPLRATTPRAASPAGAAGLPTNGGALPEAPGYEVLRELGRGGMGVVFLARDRRLNRHVALKMILAGAASGQAERARFRVEAETVARLQHPNIVQIFEVGEWNGQPYLALEYLGGGSLAKQLGQPFAAPAAAELAETLARAVQYAHEQGIIHRDLKPGNILLQNAECGVRSAELKTGSSVPHSALRIPHCKITDFGLAKRLDAETMATQSGSILGTPNYMAPEQAAGRVKEVGPACDVYALGAILYELLTGRPPFLGESPMETVLRVIHDEPASPRLLNPRVPRDLETICLKCLRKEPAKRYDSAGALADDLRRFATGRPILARPVGRSERAWRWAKRNPLAAALASLAVLFLAGGLIGITFFAIQSAGRAKTNLQLKQVAEHRLYLARMNEAARSWEDGQVVRVLDLLEQTRPEATGGIDLRGFEWFYLWRLCHEQEIRVARAHDGPAHQVAWSRDGVVASAGHDKLVRLWDAATGQPLADLTGHEQPVMSVAFSPDGKTLASGSSHGEIRVWDVAQRRLIRALRHAGSPQSTVNRLAFSPDGAWLLAAMGNECWRWQTDTWQGGRVDTPVEGAILGLAWDADGSRFFTADTKGMLTFRDANSSNAQSRRAAEEGDYLSALAVSADGRWIATGGLDDGRIKVWDAATLELDQAFVGLAGDIAAVCFSADGRFLLSAGITGAVTVRERQAGVVRRLAHSGPIESFALSPDQSTIVIAGSDGLIKWTRLDLRPEPEPQHTGRVYAVAVRGDGAVAASAGQNGEIRIWDVPSGQVRGRIQDTADRIFGLAFAPAGDRIAAGDSDGKVTFWDVQRRERVSAWKAHAVAVWGVAFSPDGSRLATAGYSDRSVRVWDTATRELVRQWELASDRVWCVAWSPDGRWVAAGGSAGDVTVWDAATGDVHLAAHKGEGWVWTLAFSPDSSTLAAGVESGAIARWRLADRQALPDLPGHHVLVRTLGFFPDGKILFSGAADGVIKLWDLDSGEERMRISAHGDAEHSHAVRSLAVTPDGRTLISGGADHRVRFWRAGAEATPK